MIGRLKGLSRRVSLLLGAVVLAAVLVVGIINVAKWLNSVLNERAAAPCPDSRAASTEPTPRSLGTFPAEKVVLTPDRQELTWTFGANRESVSLPVLIHARPALTGTAPTSVDVSPTRVRLVRDDESQILPNAVTHTPPEISRNGDRITFEVCIDPEGVRPGKYSGKLFVDGPREVTGATVSLVVTARSLSWLIVGVLAAVFAVAGVLTLKGIADYRRELRDAPPPNDFKYRDGIKYMWSVRDGRVFTSLVGIGTAAFVAFQLYHRDKAFGDDWFTDIITLASAAIAAVGAQSVLDGFRALARE
jgi:hypothetical protein